MSTLILDRDASALAAAVVVMPPGPSAGSAVQQVTAGGPIDAALIDCSAMQESSLSMAQELIVQLVDVRGARWIQLIEPTKSWLDCVRAQIQRRGMADSLSVVPRTSSQS